MQTSNPTLGQVITSQQVAELPLNGRDFVQLATLTPGTTQETNPDSFFNGGPSSEVSARGTYSLSVGGSRAQSTDWLLDGNDNNELTAGGISILPSIDAIQEFKVLTYNYSAEYGTRAGPTVLVTTKSGSNNLHGSLFEFFRNTELDARSYFACEPGTIQSEPVRRLARWGDQERQDVLLSRLSGKKAASRNRLSSGLVPTAAMMNGDFSLDPLRPLTECASASATLTRSRLTARASLSSAMAREIPSRPGPDGIQAPGTPCNKIPANMFDPVGQKLIQLYPGQQREQRGPGFNFTNVPVRSLNEGEFDVRLDHNFSSKDSVFARFSYDQATSFVPGGSPDLPSRMPFASTQDITNHGRNVALSETHIFSDRTINQVSVGFNRIFNHIKSFGDRTCEAAKIGILGANLDSSCPGAPPGLSQSTKDCISCGLTSIDISGGYWSLGDRGFAPFQGGTNVFTVSDTLDLIRGKHDSGWAWESAPTR